MLPTYITPETDPCQLATHWLIAEQLARALVEMTRELAFPLRINSGYRTAEQQQQLREQGRPTAPDNLSTHLTCPATGADVEPAIAHTNYTIAEMGAAGVKQGLRWGGGSPTDPETGIPSDWVHFDLGPRNQ